MRPVELWAATLPATSPAAATRTASRATLCFSIWSLLEAKYIAPPLRCAASTLRLALAPRGSGLQEGGVVGERSAVVGADDRLQAVPIPGPHGGQELVVLL